MDVIRAVSTECVTLQMSFLKIYKAFYGYFEHIQIAVMCFLRQTDRQTERQIV